METLNCAREDRVMVMGSPNQWKVELWARTGGDSCTLRDGLEQDAAEEVADDVRSILESWEGPPTDRPRSHWAVNVRGEESLDVDFVVGGLEQEEAERICADMTARLGERLAMRGVTVGPGESSGIQVWTTFDSTTPDEIVEHFTELYGE